MVLGTFAGLSLARLKCRYREALQAFILSPLMIPRVVLGIALLYVLTAACIAEMISGLVIGHVVVALP